MWGLGTSLYAYIFRIHLGSSPFFASAALPSNRLLGAKKGGGKRGLPDCVINPGPWAGGNRLLPPGPRPADPGDCRVG